MTPKIQNLNLMLVTEDKSWDHKSQRRFVLWLKWVYEQTYIVIHKQFKLFGRDDTCTIKNIKDAKKHF